MQLSARNDVGAAPRSPARQFPRPPPATAFPSRPPLTSGYGVLFEKEERLRSAVCDRIGEAHGGHGSDLRRILRRHQKLLEANQTLLRRRCDELPCGSRFGALRNPHPHWPLARGSDPLEERSALGDLVARHASLIGDIEALVSRAAGRERAEPLLVEMEQNHEDMAWMLTALINEDDDALLDAQGDLSAEEERWETEGGGPPDENGDRTCIHPVKTEAQIPPEKTTGGDATRLRVSERTQELALMAGRVPPQVDQCDYEQAKREITGETDGDRQNEKLDASP